MLGNQLLLFATLYYFAGWQGLAVAVTALAVHHGLLWFFARPYQFKSAVMLDRTVNVEWMNGSPDESISARSAYAAVATPPSTFLGIKWGCILCKLLGWVSKDHCARVIADTPRKHYEPVG
jgi:hypothetical protein